MRTPVALSFIACLTLVASAAAADEPPPPKWVQAAYKPPTDKRSPGLEIAGIVLWGVGAAMTGVGLGDMVAYGTCTVEALPAASAAQAAAARAGERIGVAREALCNDTASSAGAVLLIAGQITSVVAIPLFVVGNSRVPLGKGMATAPRGLRLGLAPRGATLALTF